MTQRRGQWIPLGVWDEVPTRLEVLLENTGPEPVCLNAWLIPVDHIWDYRIAGKVPLAETSLMVEPGRHWVAWESPSIQGRDSEAGGFIRLDLDANEHVRWIPAGRPLPGAMSAFAMQEDRMRRYENGLTMSFRIEPAQSAYGPEQVLSGQSRPHTATNQWRSDPALPLPAWVEVSWEEPQEIQQVQIQFVGHLLREFDRYPSLSADPQLVADYSLHALTSEGWTRLVEETGNFLPRRVHVLEEPVWATAIRLECHKTHGDPSASLYEMRFYGPGD